MVPNFNYVFNLNAIHNLMFYNLNLLYSFSLLLPLLIQSIFFQQNTLFRKYCLNMKTGIGCFGIDLWHKIVVEVKASVTPHVLRLWLGVDKGMLLVKYFHSNKVSFYAS